MQGSALKKKTWCIPFVTSALSPSPIPGRWENGCAMFMLTTASPIHCFGPATIWKEAKGCRGLLIFGGSVCQFNALFGCTGWVEDTLCPHWALLKIAHSVALSPSSNLLQPYCIPNCMPLVYTQGSGRSSTSRYKGVVHKRVLGEFRGCGGCLASRGESKGEIDRGSCGQDRGGLEVAKD